VPAGRFRTAIFMGPLLLATGCAQVDLQPIAGVSVDSQNPGALNQPPSISGVPASTVAAGSIYSFRPSASDADGNTLQYAVENKPSWATFSVSTGELTGTPGAGDVGVYSGIAIRVSDGTTSVATAVFAITVTSSAVPPSSNGTATLSWSPPQENTDGSALRDLSGYWVYRGSSAGALTRSAQVTSPTTTRYVVSQLPSGTHYFAVTAYNASGAESALSVVGSKIVP